MGMTTITISLQTKKLLERLKGDKSWDEFLRNLVLEYERMIRVKYAKEYLKKRPMSEEEAKEILRFVEESEKSWSSERS